MYVPLDSKAIISQFSLTKKQIAVILDIYEGAEACTPAMAKNLRKKGILMPRHIKLTATGNRIAQRLYN